MKRLRGRSVAAVAAAVAAFALAGAATAATPLLAVNEIGAVAWVGSPPLAAAAAAAAAAGPTAVSVGPGATVVVCHVAAGASLLGVPVVVRVSELRAYLLANPKDTLGACASAHGSRPAANPDAGTSRQDAGATEPRTASGQAGATGEATVECGDRLVIENVQAAPLVIRSIRQPLLVRLVVRTGCGRPVAGAFVTLRSAPLGNIARTVVQKTAADGSVVVVSTTTKQLQLVRGGRLVLFAQAVRPGEQTLACATGRRLVSVRTSLPR